MTLHENIVFIPKENINIDNDRKKKSSSSLLILYLSAFTADLLIIPIGSFMVWPSTVIPKLMSNNTNINPLGRPITSLETSIIVSLPYFSTILGLVIASKPSDIIGRRKTLLYFAIIMWISIIAIAFSNNMYMYYVSFFVYGITNACLGLLVVIYNVEIAGDKHRALLSSISTLGLPIGQLFGFVFGAIIDSIKIFTVIISVPILIHFLLYSFMVESPVYLIDKNKKNLAINVLKKLRSYYDVVDIENEYEVINESVETNKERSIKLIDCFKSFTTKKALFLSFLIISTREMTGNKVVLAYTGLIFNEAGTIFSGNEVGIIIGFVNVAAIFLLILLINRFGRKTFLLTSSLFCSFSTMGIGFYFFLKEINSPLVYSIRWLPIISVIIFIVFYAIGLGGVLPGYVAELFSNESRITAASTALILGALFSSSLDFGFPLITESFGVSVSFFVYSVSTFLGFVLMYFCLPETRGKTLKEIQVILQGSYFHFS
ncbi:facilitated trehalose transporter Tret1-like [Diorhabda carinulata]|uniref:facilitated trehalose transporter Tret1-like n=1 Tax=Diorhabda carinulata TaxID=1163345 RepID=UPI0025A24154|nr:facilitated trehalose transporter Tret1-like [Diorhabda carinulata]